MTDKRLEAFEEALDRFGTDMTYWPVEVRALGVALLNDQEKLGEKARFLLMEAKNLERMLNEFAAPEPSQAFMDSVINQAKDGAAPNRIGWRSWLMDLFPGMPLWRPVTAMATAAVLGLYLGAAQVGGLGVDTAAYEDQMLELSMGDVNMYMIGEGQ